MRVRYEQRSENRKYYKIKGKVLGRVLPISTIFVYYLVVQVSGIISRKNCLIRFAIEYLSEEILRATFLKFSPNINLNISPERC